MSGTKANQSSLSSTKPGSSTVPGNKSTGSPTSVKKPSTSQPSKSTAGISTTSAAKSSGSSASKTSSIPASGLQSSGGHIPGLIPSAQVYPSKVNTRVEPVEVATVVTGAMPVPTPVVAHQAAPHPASSIAAAQAAAAAAASAPNTITVLSGSQASNGYEITAQNGHLTINGDGIPNGVIMDATALAGATFIPHGLHHHGHGVTMAHGPPPPMAAGGTPVSNRVSPPGAAGNLHRPMTNHRGHSPHRYSPNAPHSRGNSPHNHSAAAAASPQHVVHVHVNPGETFSVRVGDQIQHIQGMSLLLSFTLLSL